MCSLQIAAYQIHAVFLTVLQKCHQERLEPRYIKAQLKSNLKKSFNKTWQFDSRDENREKKISLLMTIAIETLKNFESRQ